MTRKIRRTLIVAMMLGALASLASPGIAAGTTRAGCSSGNACVWADANWVTNGSTSGRKDFTTWDGSFHNENYVGTAINAGDSATSGWNSGTMQSVTFYLDAGCAGTPVTLAVNGSGVSTFGATFNNEISSGAFSAFISSC